MTDTPAVFDATFSDWRLVKGRKVVQIVLEVPLETAGLAYQVLGGMPDPGKSVWCAVARLKGGDASEQEQSQLLDTPPHSHSETVNKPQAGGAKRRWDELTYAQQAGIRCEEPAFAQFLMETRQMDPLLTTPEMVRQICGVDSRSNIRPNTEAALRWEKLDASYRRWLHEPEVVG